MLKARAALQARLRAFFMARGVMEVETPILSRHAGTDPAIELLQTRYTGPGAPAGLPLYLHSSPEFPMKRLLAAGSGPIYQICRAFRDGELGRRHNPEFTLLEWYRPGFDHHALMDEVAALVRVALERELPREQLSYGNLFRHYLGIDPHAAGEAELRSLAIEQGIPGADELVLEGADPWLDLLLTQCIEPRLGRGCLTFVYDYPVSQASLARIRPGPPPIGERFELYLEGIEIANGFHELGSAAEQRARFEQDNRVRTSGGVSPLPLDENLLAALAAGLPDCAGVALGIDRLLMVTEGVSSIEAVMAFPLDRA
ncbi:MAG: EF-P lysine aminoacylase GenX [Gammaproteobacteria bacterium]|nr:EF-P lysine aminoacylase GenX [Gammaproteobacteria bacterium]MBU1655422.1 EF-P lysine aminoacylase GenX [Gammaproteobacteria bacterium]MBU1961055.1 EF-P lysine aminoacylase GenX [Gammaproteobacteria bacterium]